VCVCVCVCVIVRVTTFLENLEISENFTVVMELLGECQGKLLHCMHGMGS